MGCFSSIVPLKSTNMRLDAYLAQEIPEISRSQIAALIEKNGVRLNETLCYKPSRRIQENDSLVFEFHTEAQETNLAAEKMPLDIVFEDDDIIVLNKESGLVVHSGANHWEGTLVNGLIHHYPAIVSVGQNDRPGIVHRLDKDTSGLMLVAKNNESYLQLCEAFSKHLVKRKYLALSYAPKIADSGCFDTLFARHPKHRIKFSSKVEEGKTAITNFLVLERFARGFALISCVLQTGRTHQIRVHLSENGAPILGDPIYSPKNIAQTTWISRLALHAETLSFNHPRNGKELSFQTKAPEDFQNCLRILQSLN